MTRRCFRVNSDGSLTAKDFFSANNNSKLDQDDTDFGAGGPMSLPAGFGTAAHPHLMVQSGKDGRVFLLDRDNLGGMGQGSGGGDASVGVPAGPYNGKANAIAPFPSGGLSFLDGIPAMGNKFLSSPTEPAWIWPFSPGCRLRHASPRVVAVAPCPGPAASR